MTMVPTPSLQLSMLSAIITEAQGFNMEVQPKHSDVLTHRSSPRNVCIPPYPGLESLRRTVIVMILLTCIDRLHPEEVIWRRTSSISLCGPVLPIEVRIRTHSTAVSHASTDSP